MKIKIYDNNGMLLKEYEGSREETKIFYYKNIEQIKKNKYSFIIQSSTSQTEILHDYDYNLFVRYENKAKIYKTIGGALNFIEAK